MPTCRYCREIHHHDPSYPRRRARHNLEADYPRCHRHWRYVCDLCGQPSHFNGQTWCQRQANSPAWAAPQDIAKFLNPSGDGTTTGTLPAPTARPATRRWIAWSTRAVIPGR